MDPGYVFHPPWPRLKKENTAKFTRFSFVNRTNIDAAVHWINDIGGLEPGQIVRPGGEFACERTFLYHPWLIRHLGRPELDFQFYPNHVNAFDLTESGPRMRGSEMPGWSYALGYGVVDAAQSLGVPEVEDICDETVANANALNLINASSAWAAGFTGKGVVVAVLDAGVAPHSTVAESIIDSFDAIAGGGRYSYDVTFFPDHGLGVASIIAAKHVPSEGKRSIYGVAPDVRLLNVRCTTDSKVPYDDLGSVIRGIRWAVENGARVICLPVQGRDSSIPEGLYSALQHAKDAGAVSVIIGGNYATAGGTGYALAAKRRLAIAVGNYDITKTSPFPESNVPGDEVFPWVMANSSGFFPTHQDDYQYCENGGTSFAGPYVAGLAALLLQQNPRATVEEVFDKIIAGAKQL